MLQHCLIWKELRKLSIFTFCDVQVEEVTVQNGLHTASNHGYQVKEALKMIAVNPVENVESTIWTKGKKVMWCNGLSLPSLTDHKQLWEDGHRLKIDGEGPKNLQSMRKTQFKYM